MSNNAVEICEAGTLAKMERMREALDRMMRYAASAIMVPVDECVGEPFKSARAALED